MPRLSSYIREHIDEIITEWESFARSLPEGGEMDIAALRDHAREMLGVIARDLDSPQTAQEQAEKARGESDAERRLVPTAAQAHGAGRAERGFTVGQMVSEFRALRASVTRLWLRNQPALATTDLTDLTRFNEAIDQAIAESITRFSQEVDRTKDRFLAILGHDLRNPLGAIMTASQFLLELGDLQDPARTMLATISRSARRMNQMVADLLEFTRTRFSDEVPLERTASDARALLRDVVAEIEATYPGRTVQTEFSGDLRGNWDQARLAQVFTNLVSNAVHHGYEGTPIRVSAHGDADAVIVAVRNEGPVIPEEQRGAIFQAMTQGDGRRDRRHMGLGLFIVDRIVSAHGGMVSVESSAEEGTTFTVRLPRSG